MKLTSKIAFALAVLVTVIFFIHRGTERNVFYGDALGYYSYLPSTFCIHNLDSIEKIPAEMKIDGRVQEYFDMYPRESVRSPKGHYINQYTCGVAIFELPFFLIAHTYDKITGGLTNGYSKVYHNWVLISSLFYMLLGFLFSFRILKRFYSKEVSLLTLSLLLLGSNLLWFGSFQLGMVHNILFFLVAFLIDRTIIVHEQPTWKNFGVLAVVLGFIALLRPTDIVVGLIPLLYNVYSRETLQIKIQFLRKHYLKILSMVLFGILPLLPQLIFWKIYAGSFVYYSYTSQGFDFLNPQIVEGLFGASNGWLLYSPLFLLSIVGMFLMKRVKEFWLSIVLLAPFYIYIIYSWHCYSYINGFGSRPMIHLYPLFAFPMAALLQFVYNKKNKLLITICTAITALFIYINVHYSYLNSTEKYWSESSSYKNYLNLFFTNSLSYNDLVIKDTDLEQPNEKNLELVSLITFISQSKDTVAIQPVYSPHYEDSVLNIVRGTEWIDLKINLALADINYSNEDYLKVSSPIMFPIFLRDPYRSLLLVTSLVDGDESYGWHGLNVFTKMGLPEDKDLKMDSIQVFRGATNIWDTVSIFVPLRNVPKTGEVKIDFWNTSKEAFFTKGIIVEHWKRK